MFWTTRRWRPLVLIPIITVLSLYLAVLISITLHLNNDHMDQTIPVFERIGMVYPEKACFSLFLSMSAIFFAVLAILSYHIFILKIESLWNVKRFIKVILPSNLLFGLMLSVGLLLVANYQVIYHYSIYKIGTIMMDIGMFGFLLVETILTHQLYQTRSGLIVTITRYCLFFFFVLSYILGIASRKYWSTKTNANHIRRADWNNAPFYDYYIAYVIFQWLNLFIFSLYLLTFIYDFKSLLFTFSTVVTSKFL